MSNPRLIPLSLAVLAFGGCELHFSAGSDQLAPSRPTLLSAESSNRARLEVELVVPADRGSGVDGFIVESRDQRGGKVRAQQFVQAIGSEGSIETFAVDVLRPGQPNHLSVLAIDRAGNESESVEIGLIESDFNYSGATFPIAAADGDNALGYQFASADVDADGFADVFVAAPFKATAVGAGVGSVYLYRGSPTGLSPTPAMVFEGAAIRGQFGNAIATLDWNQDGMLDLAVGAPFVDDGNGAVYIFDGRTLVGAESTSMKVVSASIASTRIVSTGRGWFSGAALGFTLSALDVDGDGAKELATSAILGGGGVGGVALVYSGTSTDELIVIGETAVTSLNGASALIATPTESEAGPELIFGLATIGVPENGRRGDALAVSGYGADRVLIWRGGRKPAARTTTFAPFDVARDTELRASVDEDALFGSTLGTISTGGQTELIVGAYRANSGTGFAAVVPVNRPGSHAVSETATVIIHGIDSSRQLGSATPARAGDVDGDGLSDLVLVGGEGSLELAVWYGGQLPSGETTVQSADYRLASPLGMTGEMPSIGGTPATAAWVGDVDGDGLADLAWADWASNERDGLFEMLR